MLKAKTTLSSHLKMAEAIEEVRKVPMSKFFSRIPDNLHVQLNCALAKIDKTKQAWFHEMVSEFLRKVN